MNAFITRSFKSQACLDLLTQDTASGCFLVIIGDFESAPDGTSRGSIFEPFPL